MIDPEKMSKRKAIALLKRARKRGALDPIPAREQPGDASMIRKKLDALPPLPAPPEKDTRVQDEIRRTLNRILNEGGGFHGPMPRRKIGLD